LARIFLQQVATMCNCPEMVSMLLEQGCTSGVDEAALIAKEKGRQECLEALQAKGRKQK
jgi:hypothetical protein